MYTCFKLLHTSLQQVVAETQSLSVIAMNRQKRYTEGLLHLTTQDPNPQASLDLL